MFICRLLGPSQASEQSDCIKKCSQRVSDTPGLTLSEENFSLCLACSAVTHARYYKLPCKTTGGYKKCFIFWDDLVYCFHILWRYLLQKKKVSNLFLGNHRRGSVHLFCPLLLSQLAMSQQCDQFRVCLLFPLKKKDVFANDYIWKIHFHVELNQQPFEKTVRSQT